MPGPWIDVSLPLSASLPTWPGDPSFQLRRVQSMAAGDVANMSELTCVVHTGTHVDAPLHFIEGAVAVESLPLDALMGPCTVVAADPGQGELLPADLPRLPDHSRILFRTPNSRRWSGRCVARARLICSCFHSSVTRRWPSPGPPRL